MNNKLTIGLAVACLILAITSAILAVSLYKQPRFVPTHGNNPYIMFDNKTAQACWSGPPLCKNL